MNEIVVNATVENISVITDFIDEQLAVLNCSVKSQMQINVAIDEIFSNIAHYAYPDGAGQATVQFRFEPETKSVTLCFRDHGIPYNSLNKDDPDVTLPVVDRAIGGLGIFLVKKLMEGITYEYRDGMNVLCISKKI